MDDFLVAMILAERGESGHPEEADDFGLHYPLTYILPAWNHYRLHGRYPNGKGYDDQDADLIEDFGTLNRRFNYWTFQLDDRNQRPLFDDEDEPVWSMSDL